MGTTSRAPAMIRPQRSATRPAAAPNEVWLAGAISRMHERRGLLEMLSAQQVAAIDAYEGPEILGPVVRRS
jgi:hypothetical protein